MFDYQGPQTEVYATGGGFIYEIRDFPRRSPPGDDAVVRRGTFDRTVVYSFRRDSKLSLPHFCDLHSRRRTRRGGARDRELGAEPERGHGCQWRNLHRSEEHTSELQSLTNLVCRLLLEKKKRNALTANNQKNRLNTPPSPMILTMPTTLFNHYRG